MSKQPYVILIAGPNGAGKSTFGEDFVTNYFPNLELQYFNGDDQMKELRQLPKYRKLNQSDLEDQLHLKWESMMDKCKDEKISHAFENNFSDPYPTSNMTEVRHFKYKGFKTALFFYDTLEIDHTKLRVRQRVEMKGHDVTPKAINMNFEYSVKNFTQFYEDFDVVRLYVNAFEQDFDSPVLLFEMDKSKSLKKLYRENITSKIESRFQQFLLKENYNIQ